MPRKALICWGERTRAPRELPAERKDIVPISGDSLSEKGDAAPAELPASRRRYAPSSGFLSTPLSYMTALSCPS